VISNQGAAQLTANNRKSRQDSAIDQPETAKYDGQPYADFVFLSEREAPLSVDGVRKPIERLGEATKLPFPIHAHTRQWLYEIGSGAASIEDLASRHNCSTRQINMTLSMAFLAPSLVKAAIDGRLPRGIGIAELRDAPAEW
jgi:hypothetical protein